MSALHIACEKGHEKCVHLLLKHGANPNVSTYTGKYPVHRYTLLTISVMIPDDRIMRETGSCT